MFPKSLNVAVTALRAPVKNGELPVGETSWSRFSVARGPVPRDLNCLKQDFQDLHDYLSRSEHSFSNRCRFRFFSTYMSIEK